MKIWWIAILACLLPTSAASAPQLVAREGAGPEVGHRAPDFALPWADKSGFFLKPEELMTLAKLKGKTVVLAFYPADWSPGCTKEVCTFRDSFADLGKLEAVILGVSGDYVFSHKAWAEHHDLNFALLSDHDHRIAKAYGSYRPESGLNKRTVYVIDPAGVVRYKNLAFNAGAPADYDALRVAIMSAKPSAD